MQTISILPILFGLVALLPNLVRAQVESDTTQLWRIELVNENEYIGTIVKKDAQTIVFDSRELGTINVQVRDIKRLEAISANRIVEGTYWFENPQSTRYFWAPTGFGLREGEGYYQNVWIFFNQMSYGLTDNLSVGVGLVPLFLFGGAPTPVWITPKVSFPIADQINVGAGALVGTVLGEDIGGAFGIAYGATTFGSRDKNFTIGLGYGFADGAWANVPTINLSAMIRTGKRGYFITENYLIGSGEETFALLSLGGRTVGKKISVDYGGILPLLTDSDFFFAIPWLGISVPLGRGKSYRE